MDKELKRATELAANLTALSKEAQSPTGSPRRSGDEVIAEQIAVFGDLLLNLTRYMDKAQKTIGRLT